MSVFTDDRLFHACNGPVATAGIPGKRYEDRSNSVHNRSLSRYWQFASIKKTKWFMYCYAADGGMGGMVDKYSFLLEGYRKERRGWTEARQEKGRRSWF